MKPFLTERVGNAENLRTLPKTTFSIIADYGGTKLEAIQNIDMEWIASGYHTHNDVFGGFLEVP
ncbi:MAG: hypothetical protein LBE91_18575 [Tannerella sp.]|nr:hypothetical protein [Tannerella sp.]